jgi:hypothetical protein
MKKIYLTTLLLCLNFVHAQTNDTLITPATDVVTSPKQVAKEDKNKFGIELFLKIFYTQPGALGDNVLNKANNGKYGFGFEHNVIRYYNFYVAPGYEFTGYDVTNAALAGNIENTNVNNYYLRIAYKLSIARKLNVYPFITGGAVMINQRTGGKSYGKQNGSAFGLGADVDFNLDERLSIFARARYNYLSTNVESNPEYESFFKNLQQLNFSFGIKIDLFSTK